MEKPCKILCLGTTPAAQRVMFFAKLTLDRVNRAAETLDGVAGKSINVAKVLRVLGAQPFATGFLGGARGAEVRASLQARGVESEFVEVDAPTRQCLTVIDRATGSITELVEESRPVAPEAYEKLLRIVRQHLSSFDAIVLSGTIASGGPQDLYYQCALLARANGTRTVIDASGAPLLEALKAKPELIKPNRSELEATLRQELQSPADLMKAMQELHARGAQRVVITAGAEATLAFDGAAFWKIAAPEIAAVNPIGSGDAFTAAVVWRLSQGDNLAEACKWGSATGAANALTPTAGEVHRDDVDRLLSQVRVERI